MRTLVAQAVRVLAGVVFGLVVAALVGACGQATGTAPAAPGPDPLDGAWVLRSGTTDAGPLRLRADDRVTLEVDGDRAGGVSGCNHYSGAVERRADDIRFTGLGGTEMGCEPRLMELERRYLDALRRVRDSEVDRTRLVLTGTDGTRLELDRVEPIGDADPVGTTWRLETLLDGDVAGSTTGGGTLRLEEDGTFTGSAGCLPFEGRYRLDGDRLVTADVHTPGGMTDCSAQEQHDHVTEVLVSGPTLSVAGNQLTLTGSGGLGVVYRVDG